MRRYLPAESGDHMRCIECNRKAEPNEVRKWRYFSDGVGSLLPFCPDCAEREFDHVAVPDES
jgi:NAD-dependent SIR2 family protein deacetylase